MKNSILLRIVAVAVIVCSMYHDSRSTTHVIKFGGSLGTVYEPKVITGVAVGDTIEWQGEFSFHPLVADDEPFGANNFVIETGTVFDYPVTLPGTYTYHCANHGSPDGSGMAGSFTTISSGVAASKELAFTLSDIIPNPVIAKTAISFSLEHPATVSLRILSVDGKEIAAPLHSFLSEGRQSVDFDASALDAGVYIVVLEADGIRETKQMIVTK